MGSGPTASSYVLDPGRNGSIVLTLNKHNREMDTYTVTIWYGKDAGGKQGMPLFCVGNGATVGKEGSESPVNTNSGGTMFPLQKAKPAEG